MRHALHGHGIPERDRADEHGPAPVAGAQAGNVIAPLITGISLITVITLFIVALSPTEDELCEDADFDERLDRLSRGRHARHAGTSGR